VNGTPISLDGAHGRWATRERLVGLGERTRGRVAEFAQDRVGALRAALVLHPGSLEQVGPALVAVQSLGIPLGDLQVEPAVAAEHGEHADESESGAVSAGGGLEPRRFRRDEHELDRLGRAAAQPRQHRVVLLSLAERDGVPLDTLAAELSADGADATVVTARPWSRSPTRS
jgi:hypothetical protein